MSKYTFTFKKDDIYVEFTTEDKEVVERQFQIWVTNADEYVKSQSGQPQPLKNQTINTLTAQTENKSEKSETKENQNEKITENPVLDTASNLLKTINTIQKEEPQPQQIVEEEKPQTDFTAVLDEKIETNEFEPVRNKDQVYLNLITSKKTADKFHYLMITAYYLSEFEKKQRFSLKQINTKLMQNLSQVIDHAMLQEAISQGFIEPVPDLTGTAEAAEYKLTTTGEEFFTYKI